MIEKDMFDYFKTRSALINALKVTPTDNMNRIFLSQAPSTAEMPWLLIANVGGTRKRLSFTKMEEKSTIRLTIDVGPQQVVKGREIAEQTLRALENFRGNMYNTHDLSIECSAIREWNGLGGSVRYQLDADVQFTEAIQTP